MKRFYRIYEIIMKLSFSAVVLQLFLVALGGESGAYLPFAVREMLEYSAASCMCALGGGLFMEYILKNEEK